MNIYIVWYADDGIGMSLKIAAESARQAAKEYHYVVGRNDHVKVLPYDNRSTSKPQLYDWRDLERGGK
jgi:hypothetical protein